MEKIYKTKTVLDKHSQKQEFTYKDIKDFLFEDDDTIYAGYREAEEYSDSAHDGFYYFTVQREVLETDDEFEIRKQNSAKEKERLRKDRYERYLKLKAEFEDGTN
jgi:hypothetical protein